LCSFLRDHQVNTEEGGGVCPYDSSLKFHNRSWWCLVYLIYAKIYRAN
jgi:hypothetical protein